MRNAIAFALAFVASSATMALTATHADAAPRVAKGRDAAQAQQWFARGVTAARAGDHATARRDFGLAYALVPSVDILWNLAAAERLGGDAVAALQHLRVYVASPEARADRKKLASEELVPELEAQTARLRFDEPEGTVVTVDGAEVGPSSTIDVTPGVHAIVVRRDGVERTFAASALAGTTSTVGEEASEKSATPPATPVTAAASPTPPTVTPTPAAPSATLAPPDLVVTHAPGRTTTVLALGGVAVATIATGIVFSVIAREDQAEADRLEVKMRDDDRTCRRAGTLCADYDSATSAAQRSMLLSTSMLVTGGVLGGASIAAWILWPTSTTRVVPMAGKDVAGVGVSGRF
ncbi:MAG: hypothetical protein JST00_29890 [Deltaproteobacteria bacterium]|nr:hypothetical protein [Deltaproteobacteria bacterium]